MRPIPPKVKEQIDVDPFYKQCARWREGTCAGRITIEHSILFGGRQMDALWNLIPLCAYHHAVEEYQDSGDLDKQKNEWIALNRAEDWELKKISKAITYVERRKYLNEKFGVYVAWCSPGKEKRMENGSGKDISI